LLYACLHQMHATAMAKRIAAAPFIDLTRYFGFVLPNTQLKIVFRNNYN
jgi:hypothetical protein